MLSLSHSPANFKNASFALLILSWEHHSILLLVYVHKQVKFSYKFVLYFVEYL